MIVSFIHSNLFRGDNLIDLWFAYRNDHVRVCMSLSLSVSLPIFVAAVYYARERKAIISIIMCSAKYIKKSSLAIEAHFF